MAEQNCYCAYLKEFVDPGLCYDMQMIAHGYIKPSALSDVNIEKLELLKCCNQCKYCE